MSSPGPFWQNAQHAELEYWQERNRWCRGVSGMLDFLAELAKAFAFASRRLQELRNPRSLEIGVGPFGIGSLIFHLNPEAGVDGVEPLPPINFACDDSTLNNFAGRLKARVRYHQLAAENLPFGDETYDIVATHNVLDHCANTRRIIAEAHRVLRKGGMFVLSLYAFSKLGRWKFELGRRLQPRKELFVLHPWSFTPASLEALVCSFGFRCEERAGLRENWTSHSSLTKFIFIKTGA